jgi:hypothetical protein
MPPIFMFRLRNVLMRVGIIFWAERPLLVAKQFSRGLCQCR